MEHKSAGEAPKRQGTPSSLQPPCASQEQLADIKKSVERAGRKLFWGGVLGTLLWKALSWAADQAAKANLF
jgi:hypothetical protein